MTAIRLIAPLKPVDYAAFLSLQHKILSAKASSMDQHDYLMIMEHESPVYTAGRRSHGFAASDGPRLAALGASVYETGRGGQITWHGPGQICLYPILNLANFERSMRCYVSKLEDVIIDTCHQHEIQAGRRENVGVWTAGGEKIGFVGIRNQRWLTSFGISLNVCNDLSWFDHIVPCGIPNVKVTSMQEQNGTKDISVVKKSLLQAFSRQFNCELNQIDYNT